MELQNVTIYIPGFIGITRIEARAASVKTGVQYAQYNNAVRLQWLRPRKRTPEGVVLTYNPWAVVLPGHGHPAPPDPYGPPLGSTAGAVCRRSRFSSCDDGYKTEFNAIIDAHISAQNIAPILDARGISCY